MEAEEMIGHASLLSELSQPLRRRRDPHWHWGFHVDSFYKYTCSLVFETAKP
jgi:hypothetical protein